MCTHMLPNSNCYRNALSVDKTWPVEAESLQQFNGMQSCRLIWRSCGLGYKGTCKEQTSCNLRFGEAIRINSQRLKDKAACSAQRWGDLGFMAQLNESISSSTVSAAIWTRCWCSLDSASFPAAWGYFLLYAYAEKTDRINCTRASSGWALLRTRSSLHELYVFPLLKVCGIDIGFPSKQWFTFSLLSISI